jgi:hypothetical protein
MYGMSCAVPAQLDESLLRRTAASDCCQNGAIPLFRSSVPGSPRQSVAIRPWRQHNERPRANVTMLPCTACKHDKMSAVCIFVPDISAVPLSEES